jgi:hypothetical protein
VEQNPQGAGGQLTPLEMPRIKRPVDDQGDDGEQDSEQTLILEQQF